MNEIEAKKMEIGNCLFELWQLLPNSKKSYTKYYQEVDETLENWHLSEHNESIASDRVWHGSQGKKYEEKL